MVGTLVLEALAMVCNVPHSLISFWLNKDMVYYLSSLLLNLGYFQLPSTTSATVLLVELVVIKPATTKLHACTGSLKGDVFWFSVHPEGECYATNIKASTLEYPPLAYSSVALAGQRGMLFLSLEQPEGLCHIPSMLWVFQHQEALPQSLCNEEVQHHIYNSRLQSG